MTENRPGFSAEKRSDNDSRKPQTSPAATPMTPTTPPRVSLGKRWNAVQLSKTAIFWTCVAMIAGTMLVGFTWGGWVTDATAQRSAATLANTAVVQRLSAICVAQFELDPDRDQKLTELKAASSYQQGTYVKDQGWSTMPGEEQSDTKVATACAKALAQLD
jgi:hypothetical protein